MSEIDVTDAELENASYLAEELCDICDDMLREGEPIEDVLYAAVLTVTYIATIKQARAALLN